MKTSLLAYLYPYFKGSQEDVATSSLNYIVSSNTEVNRAFTGLVAKTLCVGMEETIQYVCQAVGENNERPDMCGYAPDGKERVICESKFYASLTINQPNEYLRRAIKNQEYGVMFICPQVRKKGLWTELLGLTKEEFPSYVEVTDFCIEVDGKVRMGIISWTELLSELENVASSIAPDSVPDIRQLIGYCNQLDSDAFVPFVENDLSIENAIKEQRYYKILDSLVAEIKKEEKYHVDLSRLKASPQWAGYSRYFRIGDIGVSLVYDTEKWKNVNSPSTPFWVKFGNVNDNWHLDDDFKKALLKIETEKKDGEYIALFAPCFVSEGEVISEMKRQFFDALEKFIELANL